MPHHDDHAVTLNSCAPRRYTKRIADDGWSVLTRSSTRIHRGRLRGLEVGTAISWAHIRGTSSQPNRLAAAAGNSAVRSGVVVNHAAAISPGCSAFSRAICASNSVVASKIATSLSSSVVVAPRMPRTAILVCLLGAPSSLFVRGGRGAGGGGRAALAHPEPVPCRPEVGVKVISREL